LGGTISVEYLKAYYDCTVDIKGGELQVNNFDMVVFEKLPTINIYGYGFNYDAYEGILTGYLMDENTFSIGNVNES